MTRYKVFRDYNYNYTTFDTENPDDVEAMNKLVQGTDYSRSWEISDEKGQWVEWGADIKLKNNSLTIPETRNPNIVDVTIASLQTILNTEKYNALELILHGQPGDTVYVTPYDIDSITAIVEAHEPTATVPVIISNVEQPDGSTRITYTEVTE